MNTMHEPMATRREPAVALERRAARLNRDYATARMLAERDGQSAGWPAAKRRMESRAAAISAAYLAVLRGDQVIPSCE